MENKKRTRKVKKPEYSASPGAYEVYDRTEIISARAKELGIKVVNAVVNHDVKNYKGLPVFKS